MASALSQTFCACHRTQHLALVFRPWLPLSTRCVELLTGGLGGRWRHRILAAGEHVALRDQHSPVALLAALNNASTANVGRRCSELHLSHFEGHLQPSACSAPELCCGVCLKTRRGYAYSLDGDGSFGHHLALLRVCDLAVGETQGHWCGPVASEVLLEVLCRLMAGCARVCCGRLSSFSARPASPVAKGLNGSIGPAPSSRNNGGM